MRSQSDFRRSPLAVVGLFLILGVLGAVAGYASHVIGKPGYSSYGLVLVRPGSGVDADHYMADQVTIATSPTVLDAANATTEGSVKVTQQRLSDVLRISAQGATAADARDRVGAVQNAYLGSDVVKQEATLNRGTAVILQSATDDGRAGLSTKLRIAIGIVAGLVIAVLVMIALAQGEGTRGTRSRGVLG